MAWQSYGLDQSAQKLVLMARKRDPQSLNQSYKMRMAVPYGLERFWGEHLRLKGREEDKSLYWKETWNELVKVMAKTGITLPNDKVDPEDTTQIQVMSQKIEAFVEHREFCPLPIVPLFLLFGIGQKTSILIIIMRQKYVAM